MPNTVCPNGIMYVFHANSMTHNLTVVFLFKELETKKRTLILSRFNAPIQPIFAMSYHIRGKKFIQFTVVHFWALYKLYITIFLYYKTTDIRIL